MGFGCVEIPGGNITLNSLIGPTGPAGLPGTAFFRIFSEGYNPLTPTTVFDNGVVAVFTAIIAPGSISLTAGYSEDLTQLQSYQQVGVTTGWPQLVTTTASLVGLTHLTDLDLSNNLLSSAYINKILNDLVFNSLSNGTLNLSGQMPPAPPTGQGLLDLAVLHLRGWTTSVDTSSNLDTAQVNTLLNKFVGYSSAIATYTLHLAGNTPPAPPSGDGITDLCRLRGSSWPVTVDPFSGITSSELDSILAALVAASISNSSISFDDQTPPCTPSNTSITYLAVLRGYGWTITTDDIPHLTSSDVDAILSAAVSGNYYGYQGLSTGPIALNLSGQIPPATPSNLAIALAAALGPRGWVIALDATPVLTSSDVEAVLTTLVTGGFNGQGPPTYTPTTLNLLQTPTATPTPLSIAYSALLNCRQWNVTLDAAPTNLTSSDVETILNTLTTAADPGGTLYLSGQTPPATPSNQAIADTALLQAAGWTITTDARPNLSTSDVDMILAILATNTNSHLNYWNGFIDLSGQSPAAPPTDTSDLAILVAHGWTVITD